jgi:restriction system protein
MTGVLEYQDGMHEGYKNGQPDYDSFFRRNDRCPICHRELSVVFSDGIVEYDPEDKDSTNDVLHSVTAKSCECGWWTVQDRETPDAHNLYAPVEWVFCWNGVLRRLPLNDPGTSLDAVRSAIAKHPEVIDEVSPRRMEDLVGAVLTDFYPGSRCKHCGKSGDGGIDLLMVIGDTPFAVQVKHRQRTDKAESVHYVTHFIGAIVLKGIPNAIFVSTADHFSKHAQAAADQVLKTGHVGKFMLIARDPFLEMLEATSKHLEATLTHLKDPWKRCIPRVLLEPHERLTPYSVNLVPPDMGRR